MVTQRLTLAKIARAAGDAVLRRVREWASARQTGNPSEWSSEQWPADVRREVDAFASRLRANGHLPPVVYFAEWADSWSMFDTFDRWLTPPGETAPLKVCGDRAKLYAYRLPDGGVLVDRLRQSGRAQWVEEKWLRRRLREAVNSWGKIAPVGVIILVREPTGPSVLDEELRASLDHVPEWISTPEPPA
ncbi:MAG TPA: hypothetical protein VIL46_03755 [Gemmataceae bacterium]